MSLYADYLTERTSDRIIESADGFVTYRYLSEGDVSSVYIIDIYVTPGCRKKGTATYLANLVAREARDEGVIEMLGTVNPSAFGATDSMRVLLAYGMELKSSTNNCIIFRKEI